VALKPDDQRAQIIDDLTAQIKKHQSASKAKLIAAFAKYYFAYVSTDDLTSRSVDELYRLLISHWDLLYQRKPDEVKLTITNPTAEEKGGSSRHTVIEIALKNMPFLVDSLRMEINRLGLTIHLIIHIGGVQFKRDKQHRITDIFSFDEEVEGAQAEAPIYIEVDRQTDPEFLDDVRENLLRVLSDVNVAVSDWEKMHLRVSHSLDEINETKKHLHKDDVAESEDFLRWIEHNHFIFLGCRDYELVTENGEKALRIIPGTGLGVLRDERIRHTSRSFSSLTPAARKLALSKQILILSKTNTRATVHRPVHTDYIGIKRFDQKGNVIGERRIIGLYTSAAYNTNPKNIPFLRRKVDIVMENSRLPQGGHAYKALFNILETFHRDDLFQASAEELSDIAIGILQIQERRTIRLFVRKDVYGRFVSCFVYLPRENLNTQLRIRMQQILQRALNGVESTFTTRITDSVLARIHFDIRVDPHKVLKYNIKDIEKKLVKVARYWADEVREHLVEHFGEERGNNLAQRYCNAFPPGYRDDFRPQTALYDIGHMEKLSEDNPIEMSVYRPLDEPQESFHFKLYQYFEAIALSDVLPIFENMGLRVISERPHEIVMHDGSSVWINDFGIQRSDNAAVSIEVVRNAFQEAFSKVWYGDTESDGFNTLVLGANLTWKEITILRAYAKYLRQIRFTYSQPYIEEALLKNPTITKQLVELFLLRFDPKRPSDADASIKKIDRKIHKELDSVQVLDQDRILRRFLDLIYGTIRTNYFQLDKNGKDKSYLSYKLSPRTIPSIPEPRPLFEMFVYSPRFEGVHLRMASVARGGLRWSDRREDFRTEVLGLMKAQEVKNAVIVPSGAKGGFVPKKLPFSEGREAVMKEGVACYQNFIRGLLDVADNLVDGKVVTPKNIVRYDEPDHYLVVAADKGTATFSDIANSIAHEYDFWLGDAFASGGSVGYDHKKMGITARGAWESVKRHFREKEHDIQTTDFSVVGIGDMAGDVFGNGMLLSRNIRLVAAFNHVHIFFDPKPNAGKSFVERKRLFALPRSSWEDYDKKLISKGGGVFNRSVKSITNFFSISFMLYFKTLCGSTRISK